MSIENKKREELPGIVYNHILGKFVRQVHISYIEKIVIVQHTDSRDSAMICSNMQFLRSTLARYPHYHFRAHVVKEIQ
jgi:hypothetical protein